MITDHWARAVQRGKSGQSMSELGPPLHFGSVSSGLPPTTTEWRTFDNLQACDLDHRDGHLKTLQ
jgi:hypothetical protein